MPHEWQLEGNGFRLRAVEPRDAEFIFSLRSTPELTRFLQDGAKTLADQQRWLEKHADAANDYYFIIERISSRSPEGTIALYNYSEAAQSAEWGRWILRPGSLAAAESAHLIYKFGFECLGFDYIYSRTNAENSQTVSFHDHSGIPRQGIVSGTLVLRGEKKIYEGIEHGCHRAEWPECGKKLAGLAENAASLVTRMGR